MNTTAKQSGSEWVYIASIIIDTNQIVKINSSGYYFRQTQWRNSPIKETVMLHSVAKLLRKAYAQKTG